MDYKTDDDSHHVHPQLLGNHLQILDGDDLATDQAGNTEGRVPGVQSIILLILSWRKCHSSVITDWSATA